MPEPTPRDLRSAMIDAMAPEEMILVLEYFQVGDPEGFDEAAREARIRYERADGYRQTAETLTRAERAEADLAAARATLRAVRLVARQWAAVDRPLIPLSCAGDEPVYAAAGRYILGLLGDDAFLKALDERAVLPGDSREGFGTVEDGFGGVWARCSRDCVLAVVRPGKAQCHCDENGLAQHARD